jgi:hypothetical protein
VGVQAAGFGASAALRVDVLRLALVVVFPVIGLEQALHTNPVVLLALPLYEALHWVSDALLALPLGAAAVWAGGRLAVRFGLGGSTSDVLARAFITALLFAVLLVPGAALHEAADRLTHSHALLAIHTHTPNSDATSEPLALAGLAVHALGDGLEGQAVGLPLIFAALLWGAREQRNRAGTREWGATSRREV